MAPRKPAAASLLPATSVCTSQRSTFSTRARKTMPPIQSAKKPKLTAPRGAVDTHMHIYHHRYPTAPTAVVRPADASVADYLAARNRIGIDRTVVVQPSAYGLDNTCTLDAIAEIGSSARGIAVCNENT